METIQRDRRDGHGGEPHSDYEMGDGNGHAMRQQEINQRPPVAQDA